MGPRGPYSGAHYILKRDPNQMLYRFFMAQWKYPCKQDWTELVRKDLEDFGIPADLSMIKSKSANCFKTLVRKRAKDFSFEKLLKMKTKHLKLQNLDYMKLQMQEYFTESRFTVEEIRIIFGFRTRMAPFGNNFKNNGEDIICPLCQKHEDSQALAFKCQIVSQHVEISGKLEDLYNGKISKELAQTLKNILNLRKNKVNCLQ